MITVLRDPTWLVSFEPNPASSFQFTRYWWLEVEKGVIVPGTYCVFRPITYFPSDHFVTTKDWSLDVRSKYVDTLSSLATDVTSYSYENHEWNNWLHKKVETTITNLPDSFPREKVSAAMVPNALTGNEYVKYDFHCYRDAWFTYHRSYNGSRPGYKPIYLHNFWCSYWNPATGIVRSFDASWYTTPDGELCNSAGNAFPNQSDQTVSCRYPQSCQYWVRERAAGFEYEITDPQMVWLLFDPVELRGGPQVRIYGHDDGTSLFNRFCATCRITDVMRRPDRTAWKPLKSFRQTATFNGHALKYRLRSPNWDALFPLLKRRPYWPQIAAEAYQDLGMTSINGIANVSELFEMGSAVKSFYETIKSLPTKRASAAASAYLAVHFGFKLTILDAIELRETLARFSEKRSSLSKCTARHSWQDGRVNYTATYQVFYDEFAKLKSALDELFLISDFNLTLENWWDMVPYSFVVDWFVRVGDVLTALDNYYNLNQRHEVICVGKSILEEAILPPSAIGLSDSLICDPVTVSRFTREYGKTTVAPSLVPSVTFNPFNHLIEAAALVISRK